MLYQRERWEEWVQWFVDPANADEEALRRSLASIPLDRHHWLPTDRRVFMALHVARATLSSGSGGQVLPVQARRVTVDEHRQWRLLDVKEDLFYQERRARSRSGLRSVR